MVLRVRVDSTGLGGGLAMRLPVEKGGAMAYKARFSDSLLQPAPMCAHVCVCMCGGGGRGQM